MAFPSSSLADQADAPSQPRELSDADYVRDVLQLPGSQTEVDVDQALAAKAAALGVQMPMSTTCAPADDHDASGAESGDTFVSRHGRTASRSSNGTTDTVLTSRASQHSAFIPATLTESPGLVTRRRSKSLTFSQYEKYLSQLDPTLSQPRFHPDRPANAVVGVAKRRDVVRDLKRSLTERLKRRRAPSSSLTTISCICCRDDFTRGRDPLQTLPCGHTYCQACLSIMIAQSTLEESKMPPRCCTQPIPGAIIKTVLTRDEQHTFLKAVLQYNTPWESRIFCPNTSCGEFVPPRTKFDPKHPLETTCKKCKRRICIMCKRNAHRLGQDCPEDWELDAVLKMGEKSGWRRCYKCRTLVELAQGCTHMTCRCKAQFCYICGAVWDLAVGCPNFCNGDEELERRRMEEEARLAELEAEKKAQEEKAEAEEQERQEAEKRTVEDDTFKKLRSEQEAEMARFKEFERKTTLIMRTRQSTKRLALVERHTELTERMKERHAKTEQHLEDRQIEAEMELRGVLAHQERSVRIQLKYMEAYCKGLGKGADAETPSRQVTQKHLEQLSQQYRVRDGMEQRHQSQINVMREKQSKKMEELMERHEAELEALEYRKAEEIEDLVVEFTNDEEALLHLFEDRKAKLQRRWELSIEILRVEMEALHKTRFGPMPTPEWSSRRAGGSNEDALSTLAEEQPAASD